MLTGPARTTNLPRSPPPLRMKIPGPAPTLLSPAPKNLPRTKFPLPTTKNFHTRCIEPKALGMPKNGYGSFSTKALLK